MNRKTFIRLPAGALALLIIGGGASLAHGGYPVACCSDRDCAPISDETVQSWHGGWVVTLGPEDHPMLKEAGQIGKRQWQIPASQAQKPISGDYHICFSPTGALLCFFPKADGA